MFAELTDSELSELTRILNSAAWKMREQLESVIWASIIPNDLCHQFVDMISEFDFNAFEAEYRR